MLILIILVYILLVIFDLMPLYKQKLWSDFWANAVIGIFSFTIALLLSLNVKIPSPANPIKDLIISMFGK